MSLRALLPVFLSTLLLGTGLLARADWVWSRQVIPGVGKISALAYGDGKFVAGTTTGHLLTSVDTVNWTVTRPATRKINDVAFGGRRFVAIVSGSSQIGTTILYSTDGFSWSYADRVANRHRFQGSLGLTEVASVNGRFISLGGTARAFANSVNGSRWHYPLDGGSPRALVGSVTGLTARTQYIQCSTLAGATIQTSKDGFEWKTEGSCQL